jgi:hypothetical protein
MKKFIIILFLIWSLIGRGQYIPNTNTFSLQDVVSGLCAAGTTIDACTTQGTPDNLDDCIALAEFITSNYANFFDPSYEGSHNSLLNFRNYGGVTSCSTLPTILTTSMAGYSPTNATAEVNMTSPGAGCTVTEMGMVYGTSPNPTISGSHTSTPTVSTGAYSFDVSGLTPGETYYYRAFATNSQGTAYGEELTMTMPAALQQFVLGQHVLRFSDSSGWDFYSMAYSDAEYAISLYLANEGSISYVYYKYAYSIAVGENVYQTNSDSGDPVPDGYYTYYDDSWYIVTIVSGVITDISIYAQ